MKTTIFFFLTLSGNEWKTRYETQTEINEQLERQILNLQNKVQEAKANLKDGEFLTDIPACCAKLYTFLFVSMPFFFAVSGLNVKCFKRNDSRYLILNLCYMFSIVVNGLLLYVFIQY